MSDFLRPFPVYDDDDDKQTPFEKAWVDLQNRVPTGISIASVLPNADWCGFPTVFDRLARLPYSRRALRALNSGYEAKFRYYRNSQIDRINRKLGDA